MYTPGKIFIVEAIEFASQAETSLPASRDTLPGISLKILFV